MFETVQGGSFQFWIDFDDVEQQWTRCYVMLAALSLTASSLSSSWPSTFVGHPSYPATDRCSELYITSTAPSETTLTSKYNNLFCLFVFWGISYGWFWNNCPKLLAGQIENIILPIFHPRAMSDNHNWNPIWNVWFEKVLVCCASAKWVLAHLPIISLLCG